MSKIKKRINKDKKKPIEIDSNLYNSVESLVKINPVEYPSISKFIEEAVKTFFQMKKYDIAGLPNDINSMTGKLKDILGNKNYTLCMTCNKPFLKNKADNREVDRLCSNFKEIIIHFAKI